MAVLDRPELEASPLADLHAIADQLGLEGFRRLRKAELIDSILGKDPTAADAPDEDLEDRDGDARAGTAAEEISDDEPAPGRSRRRGARAPAASRRRTRSTSAEPRGSGEREESDGIDEPDEPARARESQGERGRGRAKRTRSSGTDSAKDGEASVAEGVVELLGNGSAFLRLSPPEPSDGDVYISAAQVRRCELVSGDRVTGPGRTPRRHDQRRTRGRSVGRLSLRGPAGRLSERAAGAREGGRDA
jgi:transcription termination factor Rho